MASRVLFVDDDVKILRLIQRSLAGYVDVDVAENAQETLGKMSAHGPYTAVVTDSHLSGADGFELLSWIKGVSPDTVRLMLTSDVERQSIADAISCGDVFRVLYKPFDPEDLKHMLSEAICEHEQNQAASSGS